jgi:nucleoside-diphosphate kinase
MVQNLNQEKTFILVKPDGVKRGLIGEIIKRIEQRGLRIIALEMFLATKDQMDNHYPKDQVWINRLGEKTLKTYKKYGFDPIAELGTDKTYEIGAMVKSWLVDYMTSGPSVKMVVEGVHAIDMMRKLVGNTLPCNAEMGTIRGDFSVDSPAAANREKRAVYNIIHASETPQEAEHEISLWFSLDDVTSYEPAV